MSTRVDNRPMLDLWEAEVSTPATSPGVGATAERLQRLDTQGELRARLLQYCRLQAGEVWQDPIHGHRVGVLDATNPDDVARLMGSERAKLFVNDPPYNVAVGSANTSALFKLTLEEYLQFSRAWVANVTCAMSEDSSFYVWLGADYRESFQPLADFIILMRDFRDLKSRNMITMRNQRGYGTQHNWMWVRQELLYYTKGAPAFYVDADYTDIPKIVRGYYKEIDGRRTENLERSRSDCIRAGNVWVDVQQVFYRMEENVPGCYAQKPLKSIERIVQSATDERDLVADLFAHSGTTLLAGERLRRRVYTCDVDPVYAEIAIRRLERFRDTGKTGWQWRTPFAETEHPDRSGRWI